MPAIKSEKTIVRKNSTGSDFARRRLNLIEGTGVTLTFSDDAANNETDVTIDSALASGITVGTTTITSGTDTRVLFDDAGVVGEDAGLVFNKTTNTLTPGVLRLSAATGAEMSASAGIVTIGGIGNTRNENLIFDFETTSNKVSVSSSTGVTNLAFTSMHLVPNVNDQCQLGSSSLSWGDLFLATGGVINWGNSQTTLSQNNSTGTLTLAGSNLVLNAVSFFPLSDDTSQIGQPGQAFSDIFLASGAVINFANGGGTITHSSGRLTFGGSVTGNGIVAKIIPRVVTVSDSTTFVPTPDTADINRQTNTQAAGTLTVNSPGGTVVEGQELELVIKSTNVHTFAFNAIFVGTTALPLPGATTGGSTTDRLKFIWDNTASKWVLIQAIYGY